MEHRTTDGDGAPWFLAAAGGSVGSSPRASTGQAPESDLPESAGKMPPNVIIAVSLDELDGMAGDMLV